MATVQFRSLGKAFGATQVIPGVDLDIRSGEFIVLVGPSGCGKSTLLRMVAGLESASSGTLLIDGVEVTHLPPARRGVGMVFQSYALYPHMTVYDNMAFGLGLGGLDADTIRARVMAAAQTLQLDTLLDRLPKALSGGQRQRVAIGRAIVRQPKVFLFDEPLSNLDAALRVQMRVELARLHARLGATVIYVTHDQTEAMTLADRIVVLNRGRVEQVGTPLELYHQPCNRFVASFIGSPQMNLLPATLIDPGAAPGALYGIRPEHVRTGPTDSATLHGQVAVLERLGNETFAHLEIAPAPAPLLVARLGADDPVQPGERLGLHFPADRTHRFAADGTRR